MKKVLTRIVFGQRAKGEILPPPVIHTIVIANRPCEDAWAKEFKFGSRYGHRGSFYHK
jgi:hypothetical protein